MPFMIQDRRPHAPFAEPIVGQLLRAADRAQRDGLLDKYLASPQTHRITRDDKTLFIALRRRLAQYRDHRIVATAFEEPAGAAPDPVPSGTPLPTEAALEAERLAEARRLARSDATVAKHEGKSRTGQASIALVVSGVAALMAIIALAFSISTFVATHQHAPPLDRQPIPRIEE